MGKAGIEALTAFRPRCPFNVHSFQIAAIQSIVVAFYTSIAQQLAKDAVKNLAFDEFGSEDQSEAYDESSVPPSPSAVMPDILVWDRQSRPDLANKYNVNPNNNDGTFVIQIGLKDPLGLAWFLNNSFLNDSTFLASGLGDISFSLTAPDPRLAAHCLSGLQSFDPFDPVAANRMPLMGIGKCPVIKYSYTDRGAVL